MADPQDAAHGFYLPGPEGTNGDYWVGDIVRVHTGSGPFDFNEVDMRVKAITISRDDDNGELIVINELEEYPVQCPDPTPTGSFYPLGGTPPKGKPFPSVSGNLMYLRPGIAYPTAVTPGHLGIWHFPVYGSGGMGTMDQAGTCVQDIVRCMVVGDGTLTVHTSQNPRGDPVRLAAHLKHSDNQFIPADDTIWDVAAGSDITFNVSTHDQEFCTHWVDVRDIGPCGMGWGFLGFDWTAE